MKIDIAFEKERVALELDGPQHFVNLIQGDRNGGETKHILRRNGQTKAKTRLLEDAGWKVSRLGYPIKSKLDRIGDEEKKLFWEKKLGKFGVMPMDVNFK